MISGAHRNVRWFTMAVAAWVMAPGPLVVAAPVEREDVTGVRNEPLPENSRPWHRGCSLSGPRARPALLYSQTFCVDDTVPQGCPILLLAEHQVEAELQITVLRNGLPIDAMASHMVEETIHEEYEEVDIGDCECPVTWVDVYLDHVTVNVPAGVVGDVIELSTPSVDGTLVVELTAPGPCQTAWPKVELPERRTCDKCPRDPDEPPSVAGCSTGSTSGGLLSFVVLSFVVVGLFGWRPRRRTA